MQTERKRWRNIFADVADLDGRENDEVIDKGRKRNLRVFTFLESGLYIYIYIQTRFQKSWDTVQIMNKKGMQ